MRWSFSLGTIVGIKIQLHVTFLIFLGWIAVSRGLFTGHPGEAAAAVLLLLLIFTCVLLHELGHALAARRYGIRTRDITLLPIGGIARLERMPDDPRQEIVVALAGPAVNVVLAILFALLSRSLNLSFIEAAESGNILAMLLAINVVMVVFNMIPAFPMDGGRVLRALLALRFSYERATRIASNIGQFVAILFAGAGMLSQPPNVMLVFIALFVFLAAGEERTVVQTRASIRGVPVRDAMVTDFHDLASTDSLRRAVKHLMSGSQQDFPVIDSGVTVGMLSRDALVAGLSRHGIDAPVGSVMKRDPTRVEVGEPLDGVLQRMRELGVMAIPVTDGGRLVGLLTLDNVGDLLLIRQALRNHMGGVDA